MGVSDLIERFIREALEETDGVLEMQRRDLAQRFHCVPSQINYVMSTRFSPEHGYIVESRRGGGGYIRIRRVPWEPSLFLMQAVNAIGTEIDAQSAAAIVRNLMEAQVISEEAVRLLSVAINETTLRNVPQERRAMVRADLLRQFLMHLV